ncbi:MAG: DJ-1/PfpI family protein [Pseudomonadota bacterium]
MRTRWSVEIKRRHDCTLRQRSGATDPGRFLRKDLVSRTEATMKISTVHLFVFDTMSDWEYGYLAAGINNPQFQQSPGKYGIKTVSLSGKPVVSIGGLRVTADMTLEKLMPKNSAMLVLPGGIAWDKKKNKQAAALAAEFLAQGVHVAAICGATAGLARAGVLDNIAHTSNSKDYIAQTGYKGLSHYRDKPAVASGNLITASAMNPVDFAREIFDTLGLYSDAVLKAWYNLYKTGNAKYFVDFMKAAGIQKDS